MQAIGVKSYCLILWGDNVERSRNADKLDLLFDKVIKDAMYVTAKKIAEKIVNIPIKIM